MPINPNYIKVETDEIETRKRYPIVLDIADTIYITNYLLGYYAPSKNASNLMQFQKIEDLKEKNLWEEYNHPFQKEGLFDGSNFGINVYFVGVPNDQRKKKKEYMKLLDLTSSHINFSGYQNTDFVVTLAANHNSIKLITEESDVPKNEFILGFIRVDSGGLNNKPIQDYLGQTKLMPDFVNRHILNAKVLVPTATFGKYFRGGKLLALIAQSNEIKNFFNQLHNRDVVLWYTMSLWGSSKESSQYEQLDRFIKYVGNTESTHPIRMKDPHRERIIEWLDRRGIAKSNFVFTGSSKSDKKFRAVVNFVKHSLWYNKKDPTIKLLKDKFEYQMQMLSDITETKRCYVSTYGMESWDDNLINYEREEKPENNLENLYEYWKKKIWVKRDWGVRKYKNLLNNPMKLEYELLNEKLNNPEFESVR